MSAFLAEYELPVDLSSLKGVGDDGATGGSRMGPSTYVPASSQKLGQAHST
jgi:hypothetical protein